MGRRQRPPGSGAWPMPRRRWAQRAPNANACRLDRPPPAPAANSPRRPKPRLHRRSRRRQPARRHQESLKARPTRRGRADARAGEDAVLDVARYDLDIDKLRLAVVGRLDGRHAAPACSVGSRAGRRPPAGAVGAAHGPQPRHPARAATLGQAGQLLFKAEVSASSIRAAAGHDRWTSPLGPLGRGHLRAALMHAARIDRMIRARRGDLWDGFLQLALRLAQPAEPRSWRSPRQASSASGSMLFKAGLPAGRPWIAADRRRKSSALWTSSIHADGPEVHETGDAPPRNVLGRLHRGARTPPCAMAAEIRAAPRRTAAVAANGRPDEAGRRPGAGADRPPDARTKGVESMAEASSRSPRCPTRWAR